MNHLISDKYRGKRHDCELRAHFRRRKKDVKRRNQSGSSPALGKPGIMGASTMTVTDARSPIGSLGSRQLSDELDTINYDIPAKLLDRETEYEMMSAELTLDSGSCPVALGTLAEPQPSYRKETTGEERQSPPGRTDTVEERKTSPLGQEEEAIRAEQLLFSKTKRRAGLRVSHSTREEEERKRRGRGEGEEEERERRGRGEGEERKRRGRGRGRGEEEERRGRGEEEEEERKRRGKGGSLVRKLLRVSHKPPQSSQQSKERNTSPPEETELIQEQCHYCNFITGSSTCTRASYSSTFLWQVLLEFLSRGLERRRKAEFSEETLVLEDTITLCLRGEKAKEHQHPVVDNLPLSGKKKINKRQVGRRRREKGRRARERRCTKRCGLISVLMKEMKCHAAEKKDKERER
ncbi:unnamed protein product [Pleuronectes platessa]|uniref:Uncharacterized protein n=1 Tax=Pleuronectes platessa TaxID=8262 RepID=A0A9N7TS46_PLEPL|nr:unnamed protein product [Pleuronectes platessa]